MLRTLWTRNTITDDENLVKQIINRFKKFKIKTHVEKMDNNRFCIWVNFKDFENVRKEIKKFSLNYLKLKKGVVPSCSFDGRWFIQINTKNVYEIAVKNGKYEIINYHQ